MSRKRKQREILLQLESDFHNSLLNALRPAVDDSHSQLFIAEVFNQYPGLRGRTDPTTDKLVEVAQQILKMREELGESGESESALFEPPRLFRRLFCVSQAAIA